MSDTIRLTMAQAVTPFISAPTAALAARHHARIGLVHAQDVRAAVMQRASRANWSFLDSVVAGVYTLPRDGMVDLSGGVPSLARL